MSDDDDEEDGSDNDSDEDSDEGEEANPFLDPESEEENVWHPLGDFPLNLDLRGDLHNFIDVFRRITYGLNATRSSIHLDTLPLPSPQDWGKVDLYRHTMPAQGAIPMHRNYLLQPFANVIVSFSTALLINVLNLTSNQLFNHHFFRSTQCQLRCTVDISLYQATLENAGMACRMGPNRAN